MVFDVPCSSLQSEMMENKLECLSEGAIWRSQFWVTHLSAAPLLKYFFSSLCFLLITCKTNFELSFSLFWQLTEGHNSFCVDKEVFYGKESDKSLCTVEGKYVGWIKFKWVDLMLVWPDCFFCFISRICVTIYM